MTDSYLHPQMIEWFNEWQNHPTKMGVTDEAINHQYKRHLVHLDAYYRPTSENEINWAFFLISFFHTIRNAGIEYNEWIKSKIGEEPHLGINDDMLMNIMDNFSHLNKPFNGGGYAWHDYIMFVRRDSPPNYPPIGLQKIGIINWMWSSPFTFK